MKFSKLKSFGKNKDEIVTLGEYTQKGVAPAQFGNGTWAFVDRNKNVVSPRFKQIYSFNDGVARVKVRNGHFNFVNESGELWPWEVNNAKDMNNGVARIKQYENSDWSFLVKLDDDRAQTVSGSNWVAYVDEESAERDAVVGSFSEGFLVVYQPDSKLFSHVKIEKEILKVKEFVDTEGNVTPAFETEMIKSAQLMPWGYRWVGNFHEGLALVQKENGNFTYINEKGVELKKEFKEAGEFSHGYALVKTQKEKWVLINKQGKVLEGDFEAVEKFQEGYAVVKLPDGNKSFIDVNGNISAGRYLDVCSFNGGYARVKIDVGGKEKWTMIDTQGHMLLTCFDCITSDFDKNGFAAAYNFDDVTKIYCFDKTGLVYSEEEFKMITTDTTSKQMELLKGIKKNPSNFLKLGYEVFEDQNFVAKAKKIAINQLKTIIENTKDEDTFKNNAKIVVNLVKMIDKHATECTSKFAKTKSVEYITAQNQKRMRELWNEGDERRYTLDARKAELNDSIEDFMAGR